jgi:hypothetical protein
MRLAGEDRQPLPMRASVLQCRDGLLAPHGWELMQELLETVTGFEIVEQRLNRDARSHEDRGAAQPLWVAVDDIFREPQGRSHGQ